MKNVASVTATLCELCDSDGGEILFRHRDYRIVRVIGAEGEAYPGFCRVIWNHHVKEMTDLAPDEREILMDAVFRVEAALRTSLKPDKINLASLGNMTPHVHWHIIPRFKNDAAFPKPIWAIATIPEMAVRNQTPHFHVDWIEDVKRAFVR